MKIDATFTSTLCKNDTKGGWTYVVWPKSEEFFDTKGLVKVLGTIDGKPFRASFMATGNGHMLPIKRETRELIGKAAGDEVVITLTDRL